MQFRSLLMRISIIGLLFVLHSSFGQLSADTSAGTVTIQLLEGQIVLTAIDEMGEIRLLADATVRINAAITAVTPAAIQSPSDITISPDGRKLSIVAHSNDGSSQVFLFVYSLEVDILYQIALPGYGRVIWEPNSWRLLVAPSRRLIDESVPRIRDMYLLDYSENTLLQLTFTPEDRFETNILWIPHTETISFSSNYQPCIRNCYEVENLFVIQSNGSGLEQLTDIEPLVSIEPMPDTITPLKYGTCRIQQAQWDSTTERVWFILSCDDGDREFLYSTTLGGTAFIEINLPSLFPTTQDISYSQLQIHDFTVDDNRIVALTTVDSQDNETVKRSKPLRVYQVQNDIVSELFAGEIESASFVTGADLSHEDLYAISVITINEVEGELHLINLHNGEEIDTLYMPDQICKLTWISSTGIYFDQVIDGACRNIAQEAWVWNIQTDETIQVVSGGQIDFGPR